MDLSRFQHTHTVTIPASPDAVYAVVSDVTRMGELSPVCTGGEWEDPSTGPVAGAWFRGHNAISDFTWTTRCQVEVAEPGVEFAFVNHGPSGDQELVRWGYTLTPVDGGTDVTESWQVLPSYADFVLSGDPNADVEARVEGMAAMARDGMVATLEKLRQVVAG